MPTFKSLTEFAIELDRMRKDLTVDEKAEITKAMGRQGQKTAKTYASRDLGGDAAFSGWNRGRPIPLATKLQTHGDKATTLGPASKSAAGPWTTANDGRNQGSAAGFAGPGINRKTGATSRTTAGRVRKVRAFSARRWNGVTRPKYTADRAVRDMERSLPRVADKEVRRVMQRRFDVT